MYEYHDEDDIDHVTTYYVISVMKEMMEGSK